MTPRFVALLFTVAALAWNPSHAASRLEINKVSLDMTLEEVRQVLGEPFECGPPYFIVLPRDADGDMDCGRPRASERSPTNDVYMGYPVRISYKFRHRKLGSILVFGLPGTKYDAIEADLQERFGTPSTNPSGVDWQRDHQTLGLQRQADPEGHAGLLLSAAWYVSEWKRTLDQRGH